MGRVCLRWRRRYGEESVHHQYYTSKNSDWISTAVTTVSLPSVELLDTEDNSAVIAANHGQKCNVTLAGRTLYKDGSWNTLCLPFTMFNLAGSPLEGATIMEQGNSGDCNTGFDASTGTLTLDFVPAFGVEAGHAYIVKWKQAGDDVQNIVDPVFKGVTITNEDPAASVPSPPKPASTSVVVRRLRLSERSAVLAQGKS